MHSFILLTGLGFTLLSLSCSHQTSVELPFQPSPARMSGSGGDHMDEIRLQLVSASISEVQSGRTQLSKNHSAWREISDQTSTQILNDLSLVQPVEMENYGVKPPSHVPRYPLTLNSNRQFQDVLNTWIGKLKGMPLEIASLDKTAQEELQKDRQITAAKLQIWSDRAAFNDKILNIYDAYLAILFNFTLVSFDFRKCCWG